jgi:ribosomal-protein-alanine N-acetyltransferase
MIAAIESDRLRLRPFTWDDLPFLVELHAHPDIARYLGHGQPRSEDETRWWLTRTLAAHGDGLGHRAILRKGDDRPIGRCGLSWFELERDAASPRAFWGPNSAPAGVATTTIIELGYTLRRDCWGQGYATEAAVRVRDEAFLTRGERRVNSFIIDGNQPSVRVAGRLGMTERGPIDIFGRPGRRFELTREEWQRSQANRVPAPRAGT